MSAEHACVGCCAQVAVRAARSITLITFLSTVVLLRNKGSGRTQRDASMIILIQVPPQSVVSDTITKIDTVAEKTNADRFVLKMSPVNTCEHQPHTACMLMVLRA